MDTALRPLSAYPPAIIKAKQKAFLAALEQCGTYGKAAQMIGMEAHTITRWVQKYPKFRELAEAAKEHAEKYVVLDQIESSFYDRAIAGKDDPQSAIIGMYISKKIQPKYRENAQLQVNVAGPVAIQFNLTPQPSEAKQIEQAETQEPSSTT
jgi:hypothetical protein